MSKKNIPSSPNALAGDIHDKTELVTQALERNLGFISNCDNKASIVLALVGILLTFLLSNDGLKSIIRIVQACFDTPSTRTIILFLLLLFSVLGLLVGISLLITVLLGRIKPMDKKLSNHESLIFFDGIAGCKSIEQYMKKVNAANENIFFDQLVTSLYINAQIAKKKYKRLNVGVILAFASFACMIAIIFLSEYFNITLIGTETIVDAAESMVP